MQMVGHAGKIFSSQIDGGRALLEQTAVLDHQNS
jgi:hypothetical protein